MKKRFILREKMTETMRRIILSIVNWGSKIALSHLQQAIESDSHFIKVIVRVARSDLAQYMNVTKPMKMNADSGGM